MTMKAKLLATIASVGMFVAAVAAQQPAMQDPKPSTTTATASDSKPTDAKTPTAAQVLDQLRGTTKPTTSTDETPSLKAILERYNAMIATGAQAASAPRPNVTTTRSTTPSTMPATPLTTPTTRVSMDTPLATPGTPSKDEQLRTILTELRALMARLEALIGDGDRQ